MDGVQHNLCFPLVWTEGYRLKPQDPPRHGGTLANISQRILKKQAATEGTRTDRGTCTPVMMRPSGILLNMFALYALNVPNNKEPAIV